MFGADKAYLATGPTAARVRRPGRSAFWGVDYNNSLDETNKIRSSVGVSANIFTTIGPLSFTVAQSLSKSSNDETETFNFRLGTSF